MQPDNKKTTYSTTSSGQKTLYSPSNNKYQSNPKYQDPANSSSSYSTGGKSANSAAPTKETTGKGNAEREGNR
jgi:hypothetical protein